MDLHYRDKPPAGTVTWREIVVIVAKAVALAVAIIVPVRAFAHYFGYLWYDR